jgi:hypothetical protein
VYVCDISTLRFFVQNWKACFPSGDRYSIEGERILEVLHVLKISSGFEFLKNGKFRSHRAQNIGLYRSSLFCSDFSILVHVRTFTDIGSKKNRFSFTFKIMQN